MVSVPNGRVRLYAHTEPLPLVKKYLSFAVGEKAVLDVATYDLFIKPLSIPGELAPAYQIQSTSIGQMQVVGTLVPAGTESSKAGANEGPIKSVADANGAGWIFNNFRDGAFTITVAPGTVPDFTSGTTIYLVYDPVRCKVMWKRIGGSIEDPPPAYSQWYLEKVPMETAC